MTSLAKQHGIYTLEGVDNESKIIIKPIGMISDIETVRDTLIERFEISKNVYGEIFVCNILDSYLVTTKKLPMIYVNVIYDKTVVRSFLFSIYINFTVDADIKKESNLIKTKLSGKFGTEICINNKYQELSSENTQLAAFPGIIKIKKILKKLTQSKELKTVIDDLIDITNKERVKQFGGIFDGVIPKVTLSLKNIE